MEVGGVDEKRGGSLTWPGRDKLKTWPGSRRLLREGVHMRKETHNESNKNIRTRGEGQLLACLISITGNIFLE